MSEQKLEAYFFTVVFISALVLVGMLFYPFLGALALALVLAILIAPLYQWLLRRLKRPGAASAISVLIAMLAFVLPAIGLLALLIDEARSITHFASNTDLTFVPEFLQNVDDRVHALFPGVQSIYEYIPGVLQKLTDTVSGMATNALTGALGLVFKLFIVIIALFFFLRDGRSFVDTLIKLSPLTDDEDTRIVERIRSVTRSLIRGTLVIALLQGLLTAIGFTIFKVPNPVLWGAMAAIMALIPTLGTGVVNVPAILYLFFVQDSMAGAIGLAAWAFVVVGLVDNMIGPKLIGSGAKIHPLFILLSVLGGLAMFGIAGFLLGPLLFGLLVALAEIYKAKMNMLHGEVT